MVLAGDAFSRTVLQDYSSVMTVNLTVSIDNTAWFPNNLGEAVDSDHDRLLDELRSVGYSVVCPCSGTALLLPSRPFLSTEAPVMSASQRESTFVFVPLLCCCFFCFFRLLLLPLFLYEAWGKEAVAHCHIYTAVGSCACLTPYSSRLC